MVFEEVLDDQLYLKFLVGHRLDMFVNYFVGCCPMESSYFHFINWMDLGAIHGFINCCIPYYYIYIFYNIVLIIK